MRSQCMGSIRFAIVASVAALLVTSVNAQDPLVELRFDDPGFAVGDNLVATANTGLIGGSASGSGTLQYRWPGTRRQPPAGPTKVSD